MPRLCFTVCSFLPFLSIKAGIFGITSPLLIEPTYAAAIAAPKKAYG